MRLERFGARRLVAAFLFLAAPAALAEEAAPAAKPGVKPPGPVEAIAKLPAPAEAFAKTPRAAPAVVDPTQARAPLAGVYALGKTARAQELPSLELKGRILSGCQGAALLTVEGQTQPLLVREGAMVGFSGAKHAGLRMHVVKVDDSGVHVEILREGQDKAVDAPLVLY